MPGQQKSIHEKLTELASNLWWSWEPEVTSIFRAIDPVLWSQLGHNPLLMLKEYPPERLEQRGLITSEWRVTENNRRARYYRLTRTGVKRLADAEASWAALSESIGKILRFA
jgi:glucan phosphorylase